MNEEENEKKGFRVVDRRRFTSEGELKPEAANAPDPRPAPTPSAPPRPAAAAPAQPPPRQDPRQPDPRQAQARSAQPAPEPPPSRAQRGGVDFISFIASLATNALAAMGAIPEARAQGMPVNFEMAREYIEIIAMLQEKTRGNLDREEEASMQRVVSELKMTFVELSRRGGQPPR